MIAVHANVCSQESRLAPPGRRRYPGPVAVPRLIEFPADDPERARRFWEGFLGRGLEPRAPGEG